MAYEIPVLNDSTRVAAADLSALQFEFVKLDANGKIAAITADTDVPHGVLQNTPKAGESAVVMLLGISKVRAAAVLTPATFIGPSANGRAAARTLGTDVTKFVGGRVVEGNGAVDGYITATVQTLAPARAA